MIKTPVQIIHEKELKAERDKRYYKTHSEEIKAYYRNYNKTYRPFRQHYFEAVYLLALDVVCQSNFHQCRNCGETDLRCLQFDHICGGGLTTTGKRRGYKMYMWIIENPTKARETFQILCANCNWRKKWDKDENHKGPHIHQHG